MVAPLDPLRGPSPTPSSGTAKAPPTTGESFDAELRRALDTSDRSSPNTSAGGNPVELTDDVAASLSGVTESLQRATAYMNSARAYFKGSPAPGKTPDSSVDSRT
jgi:hypothetical protein